MRAKPLSELQQEATTGAALPDELLLTLSVQVRTSEGLGLLLSGLPEQEPTDVHVWTSGAAVQ